MVTAMAVDYCYLSCDYLGKTPLKMNVIASPVAGHPRLEARCTQTIKILIENLIKKQIF